MGGAHAANGFSAILFSVALSLSLRRRFSRCAFSSVLERIVGKNTGSFCAQTQGLEHQKRRAARRKRAHYTMNGVAVAARRLVEQNEVWRDGPLQ